MLWTWQGSSLLKINTTSPLLIYQIRFGVTECELGSVQKIELHDVKKVDAGHFQIWAIMAESLKKLYLFFYNLSMFLGFAYALTVMSCNYLANPDVFPSDCWSTVGSFFKASVLESTSIWVASIFRWCMFWCIWRCWIPCSVSPKVLFQLPWFRWYTYL